MVVPSVVAVAVGPVDGDALGEAVDGGDGVVA